MKNDTYGYISEDITLAVGDKTKIKIGFMNSKTIVYCGMISKDIFSVAILYGTGNQGFSYNLFYPKNTKTIKIDNDSYYVVSVSENQLVIRK
ncbi:hypothetical protein AYK24_00800 [Thermoplasmatales archaeon SG8-52-4]|nr:MAG: hypothetical protein AYK24_00800 [Thermoplasmatales archaeon SG8-52-4]